jgi:hypothetical protein
MISVSDAVKILDQIPIWKQLVAIPKRLTALEERIAALEAKKTVSGRECPMCGNEMKVASEAPHPQFSFAGVKVHSMES